MNTNSEAPIAAECAQHSKADDDRLNFLYAMREWIDNEIDETLGSE